MTSGLDQAYSTATGHPIAAVPVETQISRDALAEHPFIWALDSMLFAGTDAHDATLVYAQYGRQALVGLEVNVYKILATSITDGVAMIQLRRLV